MKNLKQITKIVCTAFMMLFTCENVSAALTVTVDATNGGTYYLCPGVAYEIIVTNLPNGRYVHGHSASWVWCTFAFCGAVYTAPTVFSDNDAQYLTMTSGTEICNMYSTDGYDQNAYQAVLNFVTIKTLYQAYVTDMCVGNQGTYSAFINCGCATSWSWTIPSFTSGTSTTSSITLTDNAGGGPSAVTVVANGTGCPVNNSGITTTVNLTSHTTAPSAPNGVLTYTQYNHSCLFCARITAVSGATSYEWSIDNFAHILATTSLPQTIGLFDYSTNYDIYVKAGNCVGYSASTHWNKTTPAKPAGCLEGPERLRSMPFEESTDYKVYPNPASTNLTIEYPSSDINDIRLNVYDILGHKMAGWILPNAENMVTEDTSILPTGIYLYVISSGDGVLTRGKLMIQR